MPAYTAQQFLNDVRTLVNYSWDDEELDYQDQVLEGSDPGDMHMFRVLQRLRNALGDD